MFKLSDINPKKRYRIRLLEPAFPRPIVFYEGDVTFTTLRDQGNAVYAVTPQGLSWETYQQHDWREEQKAFIKRGKTMEIIGEAGGLGVPTDEE